PRAAYRSFARAGLRSLPSPPAAAWPPHPISRRWMKRDCRDSILLHGMEFGRRKERPAPWSQSLMQRLSMRSPTLACNSGLSSSDRTYLRARSRRRKRCAPSTRPRLRSGGLSSRRRTSGRNKADLSSAQRSKMKLTRRIVLHLAAAVAALPAVSRAAKAQAYPSRPVTLIVFVPAGGTPDIIARLLGQS